MSIVSPLHTNTKLTIKMNKMDQRLDQYTLFLLLEKQRNKKLRELYRGDGLAISKNRHGPTEDVALPKFPPQYRCLDLSAEWFLSEVKKKRRELLVHNSTREQWKAGLDQVTNIFLDDMVNFLKERCSVSRNRSQAAFPAPTCMPSLCPAAITPPSSPLTLPLAASEDLLLPYKSFSEAQRKEVNMSDREIMLLWNRAVPSEDGVDFDV